MRKCEFAIKIMLTHIAKAADEMEMEVMLDQGTSEPGFRFVPIKKGERPWIPAAAMIGVDVEDIKEMVKKKSDYMKTERKRRDKEMKGLIV